MAVASAEVARASSSPPPRPRLAATVLRRPRVRRPPDGGNAAESQRPIARAVLGGRGPPVVDGQTVGRVTGNGVFRYTGHCGRGAHTDRRVPRPCHRVALAGCVPPGRRRRRAAAWSQRRRHCCLRPPQATQFFPVELRQRRRAEQLEGGRGRGVRDIRPAHGHRGRASRVQRRGRVADQVLVPLGVQPAVPEPLHRLHVLLRFSQLLFQLDLHRFFQGACGTIEVSSYLS